MRLLILSRSGELYSTRSLFTAARRRNHFVRIVDHLGCDLLIENGANKVFCNGQSLIGYDAVIPRIGHTVTGQGAAVIRHFESMGLLTTISADALIRARDKMSCLQVLSHKGIPVPTTVMVNTYAEIHHLHKKILAYPKILKVLSGTHGLGVLKADDEQSLIVMMEAFYNLKQKMIVQEFIAESSGHDIRAFVVNGEIVASMMRTAPEGEFRSNLHRGGHGKPVLLSPHEREVAIEATRLLDLPVAGVDMLRSNRGPLVIEVNASPGLEGIETVTKVDVAKKIILYLESRRKGSI
ncbi:MAG: RimK family alpha-L-glutamate ligase [Bacteroidota bacterium]